jgi:hypothetical protein
VTEGEFMPIGTIPTSSGRSEGEGVVRVSPEESDLAVRRVTPSELVWAETGKLNTSVINKPALQTGRLFVERRVSDFRICKPSQPLRCSCKRPCFGSQIPPQEG